MRNRAWVWGSWTTQDIRLARQAGRLIDRTLLKTTNVKGNWQATSSDMISVLWFNGSKEKFGRGTGQAQREAPTATWNQGNYYPENRPHGLLKIQDDRVFSRLDVPVGQVRLLRHRVLARAARRTRRSDHA